MLTMKQIKDTIVKTNCPDCHMIFYRANYPSGTLGLYTRVMIGYMKQVKKIKPILERCHYCQSDINEKQKREDSKKSIGPDDWK